MTDFDGPLQLELAAEGRHQLDLGTGKGDGGGRDEQVLHARRLDAVLEGGVPHQHVIHRELEIAGVDPQSGGGVSLRVKVDDQHPEPELGQCRSEVHRRGRLPDAALLVGHGQDPGKRVRGSGLSHAFRRGRLLDRIRVVRLSRAPGIVGGLVGDSSGRRFLLHRGGCGRRVDLRFLVFRLRFRLPHWRWLRVGVDLGGNRGGYCHRPPLVGAEWRRNALDRLLR